jgi:hypothetical protein
MAEGLVYMSLQQQTSMLGYADAFYVLALLCFSAIPFVVLLKRVVTRGPVVAH